MRTSSSTWATARSASRSRWRPAASSPTSRVGARPRSRSKVSPSTPRRTTMALDFYHGHGSPYSWRVWLALEAKQVPYELKLLSFANQDTRKPEFIAINPRHRVPTIVDEGYVLWESTTILEYLDERFPGGLKLYPGDAKARARIRRLAREAEEYLGLEGIDPITTEYFDKAGAAPDPEKVAKAKARLKEELDYLAGE